MIINQNTLSNPKNIIKSAKKNYEKLYIKEITSKAVTTEFLSKIPNKKKIMYIMNIQ